MVWIEMVCDSCYTTRGGRPYKSGAITNLKVQAKKFGWKTIEGKMYCPECQQKMRGNSDERQETNNA